MTRNDDHVSAMATPDAPQSDGRAPIRPDLIIMLNSAEIIQNLKKGTGDFPKTLAALEHWKNTKVVEALEAVERTSPKDEPTPQFSGPKNPRAELYNAVNAEWRTAIQRQKERYKS